MMLFLIGIGLITLAAASMLIELIMQTRSQPVPLLVMTDERQRRTSERLHVERLFDRHDRRG